MNKKQDLKILAGIQIIESKLSNGAKKQLLLFVKEEKDIHALKSFILDGKILSGNNLDEHSKEIINDRFIVSEAGGRVAALRKTGFTIAGLNFGSSGGYVAGVAGGIAGGAGPVGIAAAGAGGSVAGLLLWPLYRKMRSIFDNCTKKCGTYELNTVRRQNCMTKCNLAKKEAELVIVKKKNCKEEKNKGVCEEKKKKAILTITNKVSKLKETLRKQKFAAEKKGSTL